MDIIFDDIFINKVLRRKIKRKIVKASFDLDWLSFDAKVNFACDRLKQIQYTKVRIIVSFWEMTDDMKIFLLKYNCHNSKLIREYKIGHQTPGQLEICFENCMDEKFIRAMIKTHYGYELGKPNSLSLDLVFAFENGDDITICHLYDDRGFYYYYVNLN